MEGHSEWQKSIGLQLANRDSRERLPFIAVFDACTLRPYNRGGSVHYSLVYLLTNIPGEYLTVKCV
jgi:hypothetical protein